MLIVVRESRKGKYAEYEIKILKFLDRFYDFEGLGSREKQLLWEKEVFSAKPMPKELINLPPNEHYVKFSIIFNELHIPKSSAHNVFDTLVEKGFVKKVTNSWQLKLGERNTIWANGYRITTKGHTYLNS